REAVRRGARCRGHAAPPPIDIAAGPIDGIRGITFGEHCSYGRKNRARDTLSEVLSLSPKCSSALVNNSEARRMITSIATSCKMSKIIVACLRSGARALENEGACGCTLLMWNWRALLLEAR